jgi:hypothetical protein
VKPRLIRARKLIKEWKLCDSDYLLHGDVATGQVFHELKVTFLFHCNIATILLSLVFIEKELAGYLYLTGIQDAAKLRFKLLLQKALDIGYITENEFNIFNRLRQTRNSYAHFRIPTHSSDNLMRSLDRSVPPDKLFEQDAFDAMEALAGFLRRGSNSNTTA